jgi:hypothetical protein
VEANMSGINYSRILLLLWVASLLCTLSVNAVSLNGLVTNEASDRIKAMTSYLASKKAFSVDTNSNIELVLKSGQKIQFHHAVTMTLKRPDKFMAERSGELVKQTFYYDGKSLTLQNPGEKFYATLDAPDSIEKMLDFARDKLGIIAPAGDLVYANAFELLMDDVYSGFVVGKSVIDGKICDHLAFRNHNDVDWQIWINEGELPVPMRMVITTRGVIHAPQFTVNMIRWDFSPDVKDSDFSFTPGNEDQSIEFLKPGQ